MLVASSSRDNFADIDVTPVAWGVLLSVVLVLLFIDLVRHRDDHVPSTKEVLVESGLWVLCGVGFGVGVGVVYGGDAFGEYISGYLIEKSLSVDNVFVWSIIFSAMAIPLKFQHRVLFWGIFFALILRGVFVIGGSVLIGRFFWLLVVFGLFLIYTGAKIIRHRDDEGEEGSSRGLGLLERVMPVSREFDGHRFVTRIDGRRAATPLLAALVVVEVTDVIFAVDSVPAILAVSKEPYLVLASNDFAILGLRAMYFLLANARERFHYLSHGLGAILILVGLKMSVSHWFHLDTYVSLGVILTLLIIVVVASQRVAERSELGL